MNKNKFEDVIAEQGRLIYTAEGDSMFPLIRPRDLLVIDAVKKPLAVNDVPLYKRDNGQYVMHRIVKIERGKYVMKGDNRSECEKGIRDRHIIGVLTAVIRDGKTLPVESPQEYKTRIADDLIYLLSCAVNEKKPDPQKVGQMDMTEIFYLARLHSLTSAAAFALEQVMPLPHAFDQAKKKAIRKLTLFEIEYAAVCAELEKAKIWYLPLKGILLKNDYPKTAMREMTDIDLLVDPTRMNDIKQIMERLGYTCEVFGKFHHDTYSKPPTIVFEIHHELFFKDDFPQISAYYKNIEDRLLKEGCACRMTDEDAYLYCICHTRKHDMFAGTGLRSLLDIDVFLKAHPALDTAYLKAELQKLDLIDYEQKIRELAQRVFSFAELNEAQRKELSRYLHSGVYGDAETMEYHQMAINLHNDDSGAAKRSYLKSRILISGDALKNQYPFVAKHKALYPLLLICRPIKAAVSKPGEIIREYKKVKAFRKKEP